MFIPLHLKPEHATNYYDGNHSEVDDNGGPATSALYRLYFHLIEHLIDLTHVVLHLITLLLCESAPLVLKLLSEARLGLYLFS